jgi:hypothetical protein
VCLKRAIDRRKCLRKSPALELDSCESLDRIDVIWIGIKDGAVPRLGFCELARLIQCGSFLESRIVGR